MPHEFEEHWLSAYLDNELSADERALVEQRLKTDPAAQQLFDDLKRVRSLVSTLPGWQGNDLKPSLANMQGVAQAVEDQTEGAASSPVTVNQVEYSTSLAESRLRERENAAALTRRSMRWTTIVAVAAGLATLMLGAPYLFRSDGPVTEVAQHTDSAAEPAPESNAPMSDPMAPAGATQDGQSRDEAGQSPAEDRFFRYSQDEADRTLSAPSEPAPDAAGTRPRSEMETSANAAPQPSTAESQQPALSDHTRQRRSRSGALAGGELSLDGAADFSDAEAPSKPAQVAPDERSLGLSRESTPGPSNQGVPNLEGLASRGAAPPALQPDALRPLPRLAEGSKAMSGEEQLNVPMGQSVPAAIPPQLVSARSEAWSDQEVDAAMNQVWYFVDPSAAAGATMKAPTRSTRDSAYGSSTPLADKSASTDTTRVLTERPDSDKAISGLRPSDAPVAGTGSVMAGALEGTAGAVSVRQPSGEAPAIGLGRLPADQTAISWFERVQQEHALKPLQQPSEAEKLERLQESTAAKAAQPAAPTGKNGKSKAAAAKTVVLFVTASEAREILQSLESQSKTTAEAKPGIAQQTKSETLSAADLTPAWWTRPQIFYKKNAADAKDTQAAGDEKVILILSQLPRG